MRALAACSLTAVFLLAACAGHAPLSSPPSETSAPASDAAVKAEQQAGALDTATTTILRRVTAYATGAGSAAEPWVEWEDAFDSLLLDRSYEIVFDAGFYTQDIDLGLPVNMTGSLVIRGEGRPVISLGAASYFVAPVKVADFDVWRNLMIENLSIDANRKGGRAATIGGNLDGTATTNLSKENIVLRRLDVSDQLLDYEDTSKNHRGAVSFEAVASPDAAQPVFVRDILIEDSTFSGGNWGILVNGSKRNPGQEVIERITIRNVMNDERPAGARVQRRFFPSTCFHVGQDAGSVDGITFENLTCFAPGDNCFEINNARHASMSGVTCYNPIVTGFTIHNFQPLADPGAQVYVVRDAKVVVDADYPTGVGPSALVATARDGYPFGTLTVERFAHVYDGTRKLNPASASFSFPGRAARQITLRDVDVAQSWIKQGTDGLYRYDVLARGQKHDWNGDGIADLPKLAIERMRSHHTIVQASGLTVKRGIYIEGNQDFAITDYSLSVNGGAAEEITALYIGGSTEGPKAIRGKVTGLRAELVSTTPNATHAVKVMGVKQIAPQSIVIEGVTEGRGTGSSFVDPTVQDKVFIKRRR